MFKKCKQTFFTPENSAYSETKIETMIEDFALKEYQIQINTYKSKFNDIKEEEDSSLVKSATKPTRVSENLMNQDKLEELKMKQNRSTTI